MTCFFKSSAASRNFFFDSGDSSANVVGERAVDLGGDNI